MVKTLFFSFLCEKLQYYFFLSFSFPFTCPNNENLTSYHLSWIKQNKFNFKCFSFIFYSLFNFPCYLCPASLDCRPKHNCIPCLQLLVELPGIEWRWKWLIKEEYNESYVLKSFSVHFSLKEEQKLTFFYFLIVGNKIYNLFMGILNLFFFYSLSQYCSTRYRLLYLPVHGELGLS